MKLILTGSSGFVGHEILTQCLEHPSVTSVVALTRRELATHEKLQVVLMEDFSLYPQTALKSIKGADACIWYSCSAPVLDTSTKWPITGHLA